MRPLSRFLPACCLLTLTKLAPAQTTTPPTNPQALVDRIQREALEPLHVDLKPDPATLRGEMLHGSIHNPAAYPGTDSDFQVYIPAEYDPSHPACLLLKLDGIGTYEASVLDTLIAQHEIPVTIAVGLNPAAIWRDPPGTPNRRAYRFDRSFEFDSMNERFPNFVLNGLLPAVQKLHTRDGRPIAFSTSGNDHAVMGASTGGIGSFTLAWHRPDQFTRVYSEIGTFVSMRGGNEYPVLVRKTDPKPIRIFLEDGTADAWNPLFGSWYDANLNMESALTFAGYNVGHAWAHHGHDTRPGQSVLPDVLRWLWRDYPAPIKPGTSQNSTLQEVAVPGETWQVLPETLESATALTTDKNGNIYFADPTARAIYKCTPEGNAKPFRTALALAALTVAPDGTLFGADATRESLVAISPDNEKVHTVATGIKARGLTIAPDGSLYVTEPATHPDEPSHIWRITSDGHKQLVDAGLHSASGITFSPDRALFYAAESTTQWVYSYLAQPDGSLTDKQPFYWLHQTDVPNNSGASALAVDAHGNLYVATRMGIQICDPNGRVRAILPLPAPAGAVISLCFGGDRLDTLFATDGHRIFKRRLKVPGVPPWSQPVSYPGIGVG